MRISDWSSDVCSSDLIAASSAAPLHRPGIGRVERGAQMAPGWLSPRFHVLNWGLYGFPPPNPGLLWIRYYDEALLIDRDGWVHDSRHGLDWERYGEHWRYGQGVPEDDREIGRA